MEFIYNYGLPCLVFNSDDKENIFITEKDFILVCKNNYEERKKILIDYQPQFKTIINFINNLSNFDYLKDFSIA